MFIQPESVLTVVIGKQSLKSSAGCINTISVIPMECSLVAFNSQGSVQSSTSEFETVFHV